METRNRELVSSPTSKRVPEFHTMVGYSQLMSTVITRDVESLPEASRQSLEQLLSVPLEAHQRVYIVVDTPPCGPSGTARIQAAVRIRKTIAQAQAHADAQGVPDAEIDDAIEEALEHVRGSN